MKYLRMTVRPPPEVAPRALRVLTASEHLRKAEAKLVRLAMSSEE